jgi:hypothetical protein
MLFEHVNLIRCSVKERMYNSTSNCYMYVDKIPHRGMINQCQYFLRLEHIACWMMSGISYTEAKWFFSFKREPAWLILYFDHRSESKWVLKLISIELSQIISGMSICMDILCASISNSADSCTYLSVSSPRPKSRVTCHGHIVVFILVSPITSLYYTWKCISRAYYPLTLIQTVEQRHIVIIILTFFLGSSCSKEQNTAYIFFYISYTMYCQDGMNIHSMLLSSQEVN